MLLAWTPFRLNCWHRVPSLFHHCIKGKKKKNNNNRAVFNYQVLKVILQLLWFCVVMLYDRLKNLAPLSYPIRSKTKTVKPIMACLHMSSCTWQLREFASSSDWFIGLSASVVIGQSNFTLVLGFWEALQLLSGSAPASIGRYLSLVYTWEKFTLAWVASVNREGPGVGKKKNKGRRKETPAIGMGYSH